LREKSVFFFCRASNCNWAGDNCGVGGEKLQGKHNGLIYRFGRAENWVAIFAWNRWKMLTLRLVSSRKGEQTYAQRRSLSGSVAMSAEMSPGVHADRS
jgi:hypothetical protein